jgi:hypothetical protein
MKHYAANTHPFNSTFDLAHRNKNNAFLILIESERV